MGHAKAVNHPSMATGEACAHIQGLGTNPAPKSEPLNTSTQSAEASTSNSGRAPGIRPQEWAIRWGRQSREPPLNGHRQSALSHFAQKSLLALATPPGGVHQTWSATVRQEESDPGVSLSGRTHVGEEGWSETKPRGAVTPTGSWPTLRRGEESGDWHARRSNAAIFLSPEPNLEFGPKSGQSGEDAKACEPPLNGHRQGARSQLDPKKHLIPGLQRTP